MTIKNINEHIRLNNYSNYIEVEKGDKYDVFIVRNPKQDGLFNDILTIIDFIKKIASYDDRIKIKDIITFRNYKEKNTFAKINLSNCIFEKRIRFINCEFNENVEFNNSIFKDIFSLENSIFNKKTTFYNSIFEKAINLTNTTFNKLVDFYGVHFNDNQQFLFTDFFDRAVFSNAIFKKQVQFIYNRVNNHSIITFETTTFNESLDISRSNFWCKLQFWGIIINKVIPDDMWLYVTDNINDNKNKKTDSAYPRIRETYRMIKHAFRQEGNNIEALKFHQKEMSILQAEYKFKNNLFKSITRIIKTSLNNIMPKINRFETYFMIKLNYLSNNFGQSWMRGVLFTLITTLIFFSIFIYFSEQITFKDCNKSYLLTSKYYLQFLNITLWKDYKPFGIDINNYHTGYIILFIGRIFISYGYYQTIQAFRKYGRN